MKMLKYAVVVLLLATVSCKKETTKDNLRYFEIARRESTAGTSEWRDNSFIVATSNTLIIQLAQQQLDLPIEKRRIVNGRLLKGDGGYNATQSHNFKWHFDEDDWQFTDLSVEIYDGRPYTDIDRNLNYWLDTVKRFAPWGYCIKREITQ
jgi:hypothetical protein